MAAVDAVGSRDSERSRLNRFSNIVIGTAQRIHSRLGFGFNEKVYENALCLDLAGKGLMSDSKAASLWSTMAFR